MSDFMSLDEARKALRKLTVIAIEANRTLFDGLNAPNRPPSFEQAAIRNRILDELTAMREGFMLALRTSDLVLPHELRELLGRLVDWTWLSELGLRWTGDAPLERIGEQVILYQHALVALGSLPRLPADAITLPYRSYRDIAPPGSASAMLTRLEELEQTIWRSASEPLGAISPESVRRTYAFFDATTWLITHHLRGVV